jgi:hypothetical protein
MNFAQILSAELRSEPVIQDMSNYQTKMVKICFFGTPYDNKNGSAYIPRPTKHILFHELSSKTLSGA